MAAFGSAIGGGDPIKAAMERRGMGVPVTAQQSPAAAGFDPGMVPPQTSSGEAFSAPVSGAMPTPTPAPMPQAPAQQVTAMGPVANSESELIIKALDARLRAISKREETGAV